MNNMRAKEFQVANEELEGGDFPRVVLAPK